MNEHLYPKDSDEEVLDVQPFRKKWYEVDFNIPGRPVIIDKDEAGGMSTRRWTLHRSMLPAVGEVHMVYSFDDDEPFAFEATCYEVEERSTTWIAHFREHGPVWHWRAAAKPVTPEDFGP